MKKFQRRGLQKFSNNEINNSGSGIGSGSIDIEVEDYYQDDKGMPTRENTEHDGLFELDDEESKYLDDEMMWKV